MYSTSLSRRTALAGLSAAMAAPAALAAAPVDPIFALIEAYDRAADRENALYREDDSLAKALPEEQRTWSIHFGDEGAGRWPPE